MNEKLDPRPASHWPRLAEAPHGEYVFPVHLRAWRVTSCRATPDGGYTLHVIPDGAVDINPVEFKTLRKE